MESRRDFLGLAGATLGVWAGAGVVDADAFSQHRSSGRSVLRVLDWQSGGPLFWAKTDHDFMRDNPDIEVRHEFVPYEKYYETVGLYVASGNGPDLIQNEPGDLTFRFQRAWTPLNPYFTAEELNKLSGLQSFCSGFDLTREVLAIPHTNQAHIMYFNRKLVNEGSITTASYSQFLAICENLGDRGLDGVAFGGKDWAALWAWIELSVQVATPDEFARLSKSPTGKEWHESGLFASLLLLEDLAKHGVFPANAASASVSPDMADSFAGGKTAFVMSIASDFLNWKWMGEKMGADGFGVMPFPALKPADVPGVLPGPYSGRLNTYGGVGFSLPRWSKANSAAIRYIKNLLSPAVQTRFLVESGAIPALKSVPYTAADPSNELQLRDIFQRMRDEGNFPVSPHLYLRATEIDQMSRSMQLMLIGQITAGDMAEDLVRAHQQGREDWR